MPDDQPVSESGGQLDHRLTPQFKAEHGRCMRRKCGAPLELDATRSSVWVRLLPSFEHRSHRIGGGLCVPRITAFSGLEMLSHHHLLEPVEAHNWYTVPHRALACRDGK